MQYVSSAPDHKTYSVSNEPTLTAWIGWKNDTVRVFCKAPQTNFTNQNLDADNCKFHTGLSINSWSPADFFRNGSIGSHLEYDQIHHTFLVYQTP